MRPPNALREARASEARNLELGLESGSLPWMSGMQLLEPSAVEGGAAGTWSCVYCWATHPHIPF